MRVLTDHESRIHDDGTRRVDMEWVGQTVASVCWIGSVFAYGITSTGDWLQLAAASAWLVANLSRLSRQ